MAALDTLWHFENSEAAFRTLLSQTLQSRSMSEMSTNHLNLLLLLYCDIVFFSDNIKK